MFKHTLRIPGALPAEIPSSRVISDGLNSFSIPALTKVSYEVGRASAASNASGVKGSAVLVSMWSSQLAVILRSACYDADSRAHSLVYDSEDRLSNLWRTCGLLRRGCIVSVPCDVEYIARCLVRSTYTCLFDTWNDARCRTQVGGYDRMTPYLFYGTTLGNHHRNRPSFA